MSGSPDRTKAPVSGSMTETASMPGPVVTSDQVRPWLVERMTRWVN
jgi:hypothetical protein